MKLSELKSILDEIETVEFELPDGNLIPQHFHVTEIGQVDKRFMDCGGKLRKESVINFQLFSADDYDHRLSVKKLKSILKQSEQTLLLDDLEIEVEFQSDTIGKYHLDFEHSRLKLVTTQTACLATDKCGIPSLSSSNSTKNSCTPGSGCC
jgi:hypothetical protein